MNKLLVGIIIVLIIGGGTYVFLSQKGDHPEPIACTMEALLCPDGTGVGRTGPECKFSACPAVPYLTGILKQDSNGFKLVIDSPEARPQEVAYSVPLVIKVSNVLGQLVNQKVRVYGSFTEGAMFSVDRIEELSGSEGDTTLGEVGVGKTVFINGVRITVNKIVQDNRCPVDPHVQCVQAGWVTANVTLASDTDKETVDMRSDKTTAFDSYQISIEDVKPSPLVNVLPQLESYLITFRVRSN